MDIIRAYCSGLEKILLRCENNKDLTNLDERRYWRSTSREYHSLDNKMQKQIKELSLFTQNEYSEFQKKQTQEERRRKMQQRWAKEKNKGKSKIIEICKQKRKSLSQKKCIQQIQKHSSTKSNRSQNEQTQLPTMIRRLKSQKAPKNASHNSSLPPKKFTRAGEEETYEFIKNEREKQEEMRHMAILGRVMSENYKKQLKMLETRRKMMLKIRDLK